MVIDCLIKRRQRLTKSAPTDHYLSNFSFELFNVVDECHLIFSFFVDFAQQKSVMLDEIVVFGLVQL
jgi:hypothetical protein